MSREKRRSERLTSRLFVQIRDAETGADVGRGVMVDISKGGFAVESEMNLDLEKVYECDVEIPFTFKAQLVQFQNQGQIKKCGFSIRNLGWLDRLLLRRLLKGRRETVKI